MAQYGFFFNQARCVGCSQCASACKSWNMLPAGPEKWCRVFQWEKGTYPDVRVHTLFAPCYHCEDPVCVEAAGGAMFKEEKYGVVLIDPDKATDAGLKAAWEACPYGAIAFESEAPDAKASKCTMCIDRLEQDMLPVCVLACYMRALDFGLISELQSKYGPSSALAEMPSSSITKPAVVFKAMDTKSNLVPYDTNKVLQLMAARPSGLPDVYSTASDVTSVPAGMISRTTLEMKATGKELVHRTSDDNS